MEQLQCKICGQALVEVREGFYKCSGCLSEFKKEATVTDEQKKLQEAYELIRKGNFGDAESLCTTLLKTNSSSYEAYWVRALAKNGVIFVRDIGDRMVPTCQNIVEEQFLSDADVKKAIELAPYEIAENYRAQGARIEAIRKEWFDIASKEDPYDVFICFKDSDKENGMDRTRDSEYAQDLYNYLGTKGLNVFFSRVSLMGKVSEHYEPYIYNALKTAKVMIVYGEKAEYFNSTWLRNEWSRFIARMHRENMPQDSLIVAYRGVDPYRIPSALLGGRQGLDLTKPSAFNILVDKVVNTVAKAKKVVTLERKEIKGGQMSKKATTIVQTEIQKRTIGANTPAKLDVSLEGKLRMVKNYMSQEMWQEAQSALEPILEQAPHNGEALTCELLIRTKCKTLGKLKQVEHFHELALLEQILDAADSETAQELLDFFYSMLTLPDDEYHKVLETILSYEYDHREANIHSAFEIALSSTNKKRFDLLLQTLDANEVDRYIDLNMQMLSNLLSKKQYQDAKKYIGNILSVNEGNLDVLRVDSEISWITDDGRFIQKFETLLKYAKDPNEYVQYFVNKILEDKKVSAEEAELLKKLLTYYKGDLIQLKASLLLITSFLIEGKQFEQAAYFDNLILSEDPQCADAWLYLCFVGMQSTSLEEMIQSDTPMNRCRGFDEYCSLVNDAKQKEIFAALKKQQELIAQKNLKQYKMAATLQKKDRINELEKAVAIYTSIADFKDSAEQALACEKRITELQSAAAEKQLAVQKAKKKAFKVFKITAASAAAIALVVVLLVTLIIPLIRFSSADKLFNEGKFEEAMAIYDDLDGFSDSEQRITILNGIGQIDESNFEEGINTILSAGVPVKLTYGMAGGDFSGSEHIRVPKNDTYVGMMSLSTSANVNVVPLAESNVPETSEFTYNSSADFAGIQTPGRNGYRFVEWKLEEYSYQVKGTFELKLTAIWSTKDYVVSYDLAGGVLDGTNVSEYDPEDDTYTLINPTRTGYTFAGWIGTDLSEPTVNVTIPTGSYGDRTYTATWTANEYTVTYDTAGGTVASQTQKVTYDTDVEYLVPERAGYIFLGWFEGETKHENGEWMYAEDLVLVAKWEIITYNITYTVDYGYIDYFRPTQYNVESDDLKIPTPNMSGYTFLGWTYDGQSEPVKDVVIQSGSIGDKHYTANWQANTYKITFNANGGTVSSDTITVTYDQAYTLPEPQWTGHTFIGWFNGSQKVTDGTWLGTADLSLVAQWDIIEYSLTYDLNGGTNAETNSGTYTVNDQITLSEPTRTGYTFLGWTYEGQTTPIKQVVIEKGTIGNKSFTANWQANTYSLTFDVNGGSCDTAQMTVTYDQSFELPTPVWEGHAFSGWYSNGKKITNGTFTYVADMALVAQWDVVEYTVSYNMNGGNNHAQNPAHYNCYETFTLLDPSRTGYTFLGWTYEGQSTPTKDVTVNVGTIGEKTYTANWQANTYTVTFDANGGTVSHATMDVTFDASVTLPTPTKTGYHFDGWFVGAQQYVSGTWGTASDITLTAKWTAKNYTLSYDANGGSVSAASKLHTYDSTYTLLTPTRAGYQFLGWYHEDTLINQTGTWNFTEDFAVVAKWQAITYTVIYNAGVGTPSVNSAQVTYDAGFTPATASRVGYIFDGWYYNGTKYDSETWTIAQDVTLTAKWTPRTDISYVVNHYQQNAQDDGYTLESTLNLTGTADASISPALKNYEHFIAPAAKTVTVAPDGSLVVNYYYDRETYSLTYVTNGGEMIKTQAYKYEQLLVIATPERAGYTFGGWFTDATLKSAYSATATLNEDTTLYAYWTEENKPADFTYSGTENITVSAYNGTSTTMWIPAYIGGVPVTTIPASAFENQTALRKVVVPDTVIEIGAGAFKGCNALEDITLPFVGASKTATAYNAVFGHIFGYTRVKYGSSGVNTPDETYIHQQYYGTTVPGAVWQYTCQNYPTNGYGYYYSCYSYYIPTTIKNVTITSQAVIPTAAFNHCDFIETIVLSDTVERISEYAFAGCSGLMSITVPDSVTSIAEGAFSGCSGLTSITLPFVGGSAKPEEGPYEYPFGYIFGSISYEGGTVIEQLYYASNTNGSSGATSSEYCIPDGLTTVTVTGGELLSCAFYKCTMLSDITILSPVEHINHHAFYGCTGLTSISLPNSLKTIGASVFADCSSLTDITIPNGVTSIGQAAFYKCNSLAEIAIPDSVDSIGNSAFAGCTGLTEMTIPDNVTSLGESVFKDCSGLTSIRIGAGIIDIPKAAFINCTILTEITMDGNVVSIGEAAFKGCTNLETFALPDSVTSIGTDAFDSCTNLTSISFGNSLETIGVSAFSGCTNLADVTIPDSTTSIGIYAFSGCTGLTSLAIGNGDTEIGRYAFSGCTGLTTVTIGNGCVSIGESAFSGCTGLTSITLGNGVTNIDTYAFKDCTALTSIVIPDSVTSIGIGTFSGCSKLENITVPFVGGSVKTATDTFQYPFGYIFGSSSYTGGVETTQYYYGASTNSSSSSIYYIPASLKSVTVTGGNVFYGAFSNCTGLTSITIGDNVTSIGSSAFSGCKSLSSINIPEGVTSIGTGVFSGCKSLSSINIPEGVTSIGESAFKRCTGLTSITIPDGVTHIGAEAFAGCTGFTSITVPDSVVSIGKAAFAGCSNLESITLPFVGRSVPTSQDAYQFPFGYIFSSYIPSPNGNTVSYTGGCVSVSSQFYGSSTSSLTEFVSYIPENLKSVTITGGNILRGAFQGCFMLTNITIPDGVTSIGNYAFSGCSGLTNMTIPDSVTTIGDSAFSGCSGLTSIKIPDHVTSIGDYAFENCAGLTSITVPDSVMSIGKSAFSSCTGLTSISVPFIGTEKDGTGAECFGCIFGATYYQNQAASLPESLKTVIVTGGSKIGEYAFYNCSGLTSITIPNNVINIGEYAFYNCSSLTSITIPNNVISISDYAYENCTGLTSITIPDCVRSIGRVAFRGCTGLTSVTIPENLTSIGDAAFFGCDNIKDVYYTGDIAGWLSISLGGFYAHPLNSESSFYINGELVTEVVIPDGITSISDYAFYNCTSLTSVTIPNSVTSIGYAAFENCKNLTSITIPDSVTSIGDCAFYRCAGLTNITISDKITSIGYATFGDCTNLTSIAIPDSVVSIGDHAFRSCYGLTSIKIPDSVTRIGVMAFYGCWLTDVYYTGTEKEWAAITIGSDNSYLTDATIHYNWTGEES